MRNARARANRLLRFRVRDVVPNTNDGLSAAQLRLLERAAVAVVRELQARYRLSSRQAGTIVALLLERWWARTVGAVMHSRVESVEAETARAAVQEVVRSVARIERAVTQPGPRTVASIASRLRAANIDLDELTARRTAGLIQAHLAELRSELSKEPA